jgi:hypothetical protein
MFREWLDGREDRNWTSSRRPASNVWSHEKRSIDDDSASEYATTTSALKGLFSKPRQQQREGRLGPRHRRKDPEPLTYFMDGSRRVFRFSDIILPDGRYFPVLAGQVGVAVLARTANGAMAPLREFVQYRNILVFPDTVDRADREA